MEKLTVHASTSYDIIIDRNILSDSGNMIKSVTKANKAVIVTDDIVNSLYADTVYNSLVSAGFSAEKFVFPNGESSKCSETLNKLYGFLTDCEITRSDCLVALGGGVVGDLTGYAAATYLRGIDYIQIPTTLLAQVDSSVGGKTAIDIPEGKNLVGAFKQPKLVICDVNTLSTLKPETFADGMGEVIKYAMITSGSLFEKLMNSDINDVLDDVIYECIGIKRDIVENDEFDTGERMLLNFGHTLGHAIEKLYNYTGITHGSAVAVGMCMITEMSENLGITETGTLDRLKKCVEKYSLPTECKFSADELKKHCVNDKKRSGKTINLVICTKTGASAIKRVDIEKFCNGEM